ncbi:MAG: hypothetical protein WAO58_10210 [Fimbriimonadaceae bacterium]
MSKLFATLALSLLLGGTALTQTPAGVLAAKIKQETGMQFTSKTTHSKISGGWACIVLKLKSPDAGQATAIGILVRRKNWIVKDYVIGTAMQGAIPKLKEKFPKAPKSIFPRKM